MSLIIFLRLLDWKIIYYEFLLIIFNLKPEELYENKLILDHFIKVSRFPVPIR